MSTTPIQIWPADAGRVRRISAAGPMTTAIVSQTSINQPVSVKTSHSGNAPSALAANASIVRRTSLRRGCGRAFASAVAGPASGGRGRGRGHRVPAYPASSDSAVDGGPGSEQGLRGAGHAVAAAHDVRLPARGTQHSRGVLHPRVDDRCCAVEAGVADRRARCRRRAAGPSRSLRSRAGARSRARAGSPSRVRRAPRSTSIRERSPAAVRTASRARCARCSRTSARWSPTWSGVSIGSRAGVVRSVIRPTSRLLNTPNDATVAAALTAHSKLLCNRSSASLAGGHRTAHVRAAAGVEQDGHLPLPGTFLLAHHERPGACRGSPVDLAQRVARAVLARRCVVGAARADRSGCRRRRRRRASVAVRRCAAVRRPAPRRSRCVAVNERRTSTRWNGSVNRMCSGPAR